MGGRSADWVLPSPCFPHPRAPHPATKPVALPLPAWQAAWPGPFSKEAHFLPLWVGLDELSSLPRTVRPLHPSVSRPQARTAAGCCPKEPSVSFPPSSQLETQTPALL